MTTEYTVTQCFRCGQIVPAGHVHVCANPPVLTEARVRGIFHEEIQSSVSRANSQALVGLVTQEEYKADKRLLRSSIERVIEERSARTGIVGAMEQADEMQRAYNKDALRRARDEALEEAAAAAGEANGAACRIRALKSQPATAPVVGTCATCGVLRVKGEQHECKSAAREFLGIKLVPDSAQENDTMQWKQPAPAQPCISYKHPWGCEHSQPSAEKPPVPGDGRVMSMSGWAYDKMEAEIAALRRGRDDMDAERRELMGKLAAAEKALDEIATHVTHRGIAGFGIGDILKRTGRLQP